MLHCLQQRNVVSNTFLLGTKPNPRCQENRHQEERICYVTDVGSVMVMYNVPLPKKHPMADRQTPCSFQVVLELANQLASTCYVAGLDDMGTVHRTLEVMGRIIV